MSPSSSTGETRVRSKFLFDNRRDFPPDGGVDGGDAIDHMLAPFRSSRHELVPGVPQIRLPAVRQDIEQDFRLHQTLVDFCRALAPAALAHDQLAQRGPLGRW